MSAVFPSRQLVDPLPPARHDAKEMHLTHFEPVLVSDEDLDDLASFTSFSAEECRTRLASYSLSEHAAAWKGADPRAPEAIMDFYKTTDLYIWELMQWHASVHRFPYRAALEDFAVRFPRASGYTRVLDYGSGVGSDSIFLASRGYDMTLVDVPGPTFEFAKHRFRRRKLKASFVEATSPLPELEGPFDAAVCFDVFEHLPNPVEAARRIVRALRPDGILLEQSTFEASEAHPCHLAEGIRRFGNARWRIYLAGLGLDGEGSLMYRKPRHARRRRLEKARFALWRATGIWLTYVPRS